MEFYILCLIGALGFAAVAFASLLLFRFLLRNRNNEPRQVLCPYCQQPNMPGAENCRFCLRKLPAQPSGSE